MSIPDRIGGQGVIRVLSNISGTSTAKIVDLSDIDISSLADGFVLEYNANTSKFITTDTFRFLRNVNVSGAVTAGSIDVSGVTTFRGDLYVGSDLYVKDFIVYQNQYNQGGVAYFNNDGQLVSAGGTFSTLDTSGLVLTIDEATGITSWTTSVDGGEF